MGDGRLALSIHVQSQHYPVLNYWRRQSQMPQSTDMVKFTQLPYVWTDCSKYEDLLFMKWQPCTASGSKGRNFEGEGDHAWCSQQEVLTKDLASHATQSSDHASLSLHTPQHPANQGDGLPEEIAAAAMTLLPIAPTLHPCSQPSRNRKVRHQVLYRAAQSRKLDRRRTLLPWTGSASRACSYTCWKPSKFSTASCTSIAVEDTASVGLQAWSPPVDQRNSIRLAFTFEPALAANEIEDVTKPETGETSAGRKRTNLPAAREKAFEEPIIDAIRIYLNHEATEPVPARTQKWPFLDLREKAPPAHLKLHQSSRWTSAKIGQVTPVDAPTRPQ